MHEPTEAQHARRAALLPLMAAALPALIAKQAAHNNPEEPGEAARLSEDQIGEIAFTAYELAEASLCALEAGEVAQNGTHEN